MGHSPGEPWTLMTDGGSRGNPGPAAAGVILRDPGGAVQHAVGLYLGQMTNNSAEYHALLAGLEEAVRRKVPSLRVLSDSELMVRQINGHYRVKSPDLQPLYERAMDLLGRLPAVSLQHVRREENAQADALANRALDARADVNAWPRESPATSDTTAGAWPPDHFRVMCVRGPAEPCPNDLTEGSIWEFDGTVPSGLCVYAATGILGAVVVSRPGSRSVNAQCARAGCGAMFRIEMGRGNG